MDDYNNNNYSTTTFVTRLTESMEHSTFEMVTYLDIILFFTLVVLGMEVLNVIVNSLGFLSAGDIPVRGKHLDDLPWKHYLFIALNKLASPPFVYFLIRFMYHEPNIRWSMSEVTWSNTLAVIPMIFIVYDFFYTILHWALHIKGIYEYIHKHHHHQKAPSRAQVDAVNVHPIEFFLGEYNHILAVYISSRWLQIHVLGVLLFVIIGGGLASLNHTRFNISVSIWNITFYDSKSHDVHHRIPQSNYGQYIMLWDYVFGSFRSYNENDRINPNAQLDPKTGKSMEYKTQLADKKVK